MPATKVFADLGEAIAASDKLNAKNKKTSRVASVFGVQIGEVTDKDVLHSLLQGEKVYCVGKYSQQMSRGLLETLSIELKPISASAIEAHREHHKEVVTAYENPTKSKEIG